MIYIDSSFFVAFVDKKDDWHNDAVRIKNSERSKQKFVVSNFIISEALTIIGKRMDGRIANELFRYFIDNCVIIYANEEEFLEAIPVFLEHNGRISIPDAISIVLMMKNDIKEIISFDSDFDKVSGISRVH